MKCKQLNLSQPHWDFKTQHEMKSLVRVNTVALQKQLVFIDEGRECRERCGVADRGDGEMTEPLW